MKKVLAAATVSLVALVATATALAAGGEAYKVTAPLTSGAEVPKPMDAHGKGAFSGTYVEQGSGATLTWKLTFSGLTGSATAAHIHTAKPGVAGPVVVPLCGPCKSGQTGTAKLTKQVISALESGDAYVNVHTAKNAGGEIRGQAKVKS
jgi:hypothetical protein